MTNADSENRWIPSRYGQIFTKSKNWVLRLVDGALVLFVDGKVKVKFTLDGKSRPLIKLGVLWADITFRAGQPDAIRIDGLPNEQARKLEEAIAACERPYLFNRAYDQILTWLQQGAGHLAQGEKDRRWIPQSWQAAFESRRPRLELSDEELWKLFRDPSVRARLPGEADYVESVLKIWRRDWPAYWAQKNEEHTQRELVACKDLFDQVESKPLTEEQARAVVCFDDRVLVDGFDVARAVRVDNRLNDVMLIALTGYAAESDKSRALAAGFDYHLTKPLSLEKLQYILANRTGGKFGGIV